MKKRRTFILSAIGSCIVFFSGCSHEYYTPVTQPITLFTQKNQWELSGNIGNGDHVSIRDVSVAHSFSSHIAAFADYSYARSLVGQYESSNGMAYNAYNKMQSNYGEVAAGYFTPFKETFLFNIYGGMGWNEQHHQYDYDVFANFKYKKYFIQPVIGYVTRVLQFGFSTRLSSVNYDRIQTVDFMVGQPLKKGNLFLEPAFTMRGSWGPVRGGGQIQIVNLLYPNHAAYQYSNVVISVGFQVTLPWKQQMKK